MLFYIIEIYTFFIKVEALKLLIILQEYNFPRQNLNANSVAYVHLRHSPNYRRICSSTMLRENHKKAQRILPMNER